MQMSSWTVTGPVFPYLSLKISNTSALQYPFEVAKVRNTDLPKNNVQTWYQPPLPSDNHTLSQGWGEESQGVFSVKNIVVREWHVKECTFYNK